MVKQKTDAEKSQEKVARQLWKRYPLWQLDIAEVTGHNLEARGQSKVNRLLASGWRLLHIYTLKYEEGGVWRERPMAILGRLRNNRNHFQLESAPPSSL